MRAGGIRPGSLIEYLTELGFLPFALRDDELEAVDLVTLRNSDTHRDLFWARPVL